MLRTGKSSDCWDGPNGARKDNALDSYDDDPHAANSSGTARIGGHDVIKDPDGVRHGLGVIPQAFTSDPELTARENMLIHAPLYGVPSDVDGIL